MVRKIPLNLLALITAFFILVSTPLIPLARANAIAPTVYEQRDLGDVGPSEFTYSLSADCTAATITIIVMNGTNRPVEGAKTYLSYIEFAPTFISSPTTGPDGTVVIKLPGNPIYMRGMFALLLEKNGYRNKEVHFDISDCYGGKPKPPSPTPAVQPAKPAAGANTSGGTGTINKNNSGGSGAISASHTTNKTNGTEVSGNKTGGLKAQNQSSTPGFNLSAILGAGPECAAGFSEAIQPVLPVIAVVSILTLLLLTISTIKVRRKGRKYGRS